MLDFNVVGRERERDIEAFIAGTERLQKTVKIISKKGNWGKCFI